MSRALAAWASLASWTRRSPSRVTSFSSTASPSEQLSHMH